MRMRTLESNEHLVLKEVRLRSLQESPDAFCVRYDDEQAKPMSYWVDLLASSYHPNTHFVVFDDNAKPVGLVFGLRDMQSNTTARIAGLWVEPSHRRLGVAQHLLDAILNWASANGCSLVKLWVTKSSTAAIKFYRKNLFMENGKCKPLPSNPKKTIMQLEKRLDTTL